MVGEGSQYPWAAQDANGNPFDGGKTYKLRLPPNIPVKDFWSVIVYDTQTRSMLQTDQPALSVSRQNKAVKVNADGSVDVWFGPKAPEGMEHNWIQTIPNKGWFLILRLYGTARALVQQDLAARGNRTRALRLTAAQQQRGIVWRDQEWA